MKTLKVDRKEEKNSPKRKEVRLALIYFSIAKKMCMNL